MRSMLTFVGTLFESLKLKTKPPDKEPDKLVIFDSRYFSISTEEHNRYAPISIAKYTHSVCLFKRLKKTCWAAIRAIIHTVHCWGNYLAA